VQGLPGGVALHLDVRMGRRILSCRRQQTAISGHMLEGGGEGTFGRRRKKFEDFFLTRRDWSGILG
jgi:hypothetical protein